MVDLYNPSQTKQSWQGLTITTSAAQQINRLTANDVMLQGMRLSVKKSGCAGFAYDLSLAKTNDNNDFVYENEGAKVFVPQDVMPYVDGTPS